MSKLKHISISHFRGIEHFEQDFEDGITCIIGRGDSGKSTILDAIAYLFAQTWSLHFNDSDFYNCDTSSSIIIEGVVSDVPDDLINKYDKHLRGLTKDGNLVDNMETEDAIDAEPVLTLRLSVSKDLEPSWNVVSYNGSDPTMIKANDRGKLNVFAISDYTDRHFSLNKGNPLYSLYKQLNGETVPDEENKVLDIVRNAKTAFDDSIGEKFDTLIGMIKKVSSSLGLSLDDMKAMLDFRDLTISESKVSIHENGVPVRLKGKGSRRMLSLAIQLALTQPSGVILIDEIEQGLEPDRVQHLVNVLAGYQNKQVIITTHSSNVVVEIPCTALYVKRKGMAELLHVDNELQGSVRGNPEAFFAKKVLVCEGATEVGICRAINEKRIKEGKLSASCKGVRFADGCGDTMIKYALGFKKLDYNTCLFCDSDENKINQQKDHLINEGIKLIDCADNLAIEEQVFKDVPWEAVQELLSIAVQKIKDVNQVEQLDAEKSIFDSTNAFMSVKMANTKDWYVNESVALRTALGAAAKNKEWYKRQDYGQMMAQVVLNHYGKLAYDSRLKNEFDTISSWIDA